MGALPPIAGFRRSSLLDWDGRVVAVLYLPGCNMACDYCHNWQIVSEPETVGTVPWSDVEDNLSENADFLDGVCITGGEPTLHNGLESLVTTINALGLRVKLDTNGTNPSMLSRLLKLNLIAYVAMDVKGTLEGSFYSGPAGSRGHEAAARESIRVILDSGIDHEFRTTVVPGLHDAQTIDAIARTLKGARRYVLQRLVPENARAEWVRALKPQSRRELEELVDVARNYLTSVKIRGA